MLLSAVIVAKNEEKNIKKLFKSISWVDEIVLVDNDSTDKTGQVAKKLGAKVYNYEGGTFSGRKDFAASKARGEWLLFIDADELVTAGLREEILNLIKYNKTEFSAYAIPRENIILGRVMKHGGWWPDYVIRLIKKDSLKSWKGILHEQPEFGGKLGYLKNPLVHEKHDDLSEMVKKTNEWSEIEAKLMFDADHPPMNIPRFVSAMLREFWLRMIRHKAFLDGTEGVIYATYQVYSRFLSYAKLWEMQLERLNFNKVKTQN